MSETVNSKAAVNKAENAADSVKKERPKKPRAVFYLDRDSFPVKAAVICMLLAAVFRLVGCWGMWWNSAIYAGFQIALPIVCCLIFILCLLLPGKKMLLATVVPVVLGLGFFIARSLEFTWWQILIGVVVYIGAAFLYVVTVIGKIHSKWPLAAFFTLPVIGHLVYDFMTLSSEAAANVGLHEGLQEISIICILLGLMFTAIGMKREKAAIEDMDLPKMKAPKVVKPGKEAVREPKAEEKPREAAPAETVNETQNGKKPIKIKLKAQQKPENKEGPNTKEQQNPGEKQ